MKTLILALLFLPAFASGGLPSNYTYLSAIDKQEALWKNILATEYSTLPTAEPLSSSMKLFDPFYLFASFTNVSDEMPEGREKLIHAYGSVAEVEFRITNPKYEGVFHSGGIGLARLSIARLSTAKDSFTPGMAVKILIDAVSNYDTPSVNFHVMNSVDGQGKDHYFFSRPFSNILPEPQSAVGILISHAFERAVKLMNAFQNTNIPSAGHLPLTSACAVESSGKWSPAGDGTCPYQIIFEPSGSEELGLAWQSPENDFRKDFAKIHPGTKLYDVFVKGNAGGDEEKIGSLVTQSRFVASSYGDTKLFFQHAD